MADQTPTPTPAPVANPKTKALIGIAIAVLAALMVYFPNWSADFKVVCQAIGGCADATTVHLP